MVRSLLELLQEPDVGETLVQMLDPIGNPQDAICLACTNRIHYLVCMAKWMQFWNQHRRKQSELLAEMFFILIQVLKGPISLIGSLYRQTTERGRVAVEGTAQMCLQFVLRILAFFFPRVTDLRTPAWENFFRYYRATDGVWGPHALRQTFGQEHIRVLGVLLSRIRVLPGRGSENWYQVYHHTLNYQRLELELAVSRSIMWHWDDDILFTLRREQLEICGMFLDNLPPLQSVQSRSYLDIPELEGRDMQLFNEWRARIDEDPGREEGPDVHGHDFLPWLRRDHHW
jgi:hypothetical protein